MAELTYEKPKSRRKPKGVTARYRAKRKRAESPVAKRVRAECVERDGYCRAHNLAIRGDSATFGIVGHACVGPSEWAHIGEQKRAKTRGMKPEQRHTTKGSLMLCQLMHDRYNGRQGPPLRIIVHTIDGADGPIGFVQ